MARERKNKESKQRRSLLRRFFLDARTNRQYERMQKKRKRRRHKTKEQDQQRTSYLYCNDKEGFHDGVERSKHRENGSHKQEGYCLANTGRHRMEDRKEERRAKKRRTKCCSSKKGTFCWRVMNLFEGGTRIHVTRMNECYVRKNDESTKNRQTHKSRWTETMFGWCT